MLLQADWTVLGVGDRTNADCVRTMPQGHRLSVHQGRALLTTDLPEHHIPIVNACIDAVTMFIDG